MNVRSILIPLVCSALFACGPSVEEIKKNFSPISKDRPLGTKCSTSDSASVKRAPAHPLGPSGGWYGKEDILVDYGRTIKCDANHLEMNDGCISGYVRFDKPGYLQARSYDDYFGDVYCGWSPEKLQLKPTKEFVFVSLGICSVGDGGLDQVHEVAWFPEGSTEGTLLFSTAHRSPGKELSASDTYRPSLLGNEWQFNESVATEAAVASLKKGDYPAAKKVIDDSLKILATMKGAQDGQTGKAISPMEFHREEWASILSYKLGMSVGKPEFDSTLSELRNVFNTPKQGYSGTCDTVKKMIPLYTWLNDQVSGKKTAIPDPSGLQQSIVGHEPIYIADYLLSKTPEDEFVRRQGSTGLFWVGVKKFVSHDTKGSAEKLETFIKENSRASKIGFEISAASILRRSHPRALNQ